MRFAGAARAARPPHAPPGSEPSRRERRPEVAHPWAGNPFGKVGFGRVGTLYGFPAPQNRLLRDCFPPCSSGQEILWKVDRTASTRPVRSGSGRPREAGGLRGQSCQARRVLRDAEQAEAVERQRPQHLANDDHRENRRCAETGHHEDCRPDKDRAEDASRLRRPGRAPGTVLHGAGWRS